MEDVLKEQEEKNREKLRGQIYRVLLCHPSGLTAWEIGRLLGRDRNGVHPRITEMIKSKIIFETGGKRAEPTTGKKCTVYTLAIYWGFWERSYQIDGVGNIYRKESEACTG